MNLRWLYIGVVMSLAISNVQLSIAQEYQHELSYAKNVVSIIREVNRTSDYSIVPADIKYDPNSRVLQMLGRVAQPDSAGDIVFHLMPSTAGTTSGVIQGHQFPDQWMFSIDRSVCSSGHTLATGRPLRHYIPLTNVYKHHYAIYQQCTREKIATYRQLTAVYSDEEEDVGMNFYSIEWQTRFLVGIGRAINPLCN